MSKTKIEYLDHVYNPIAMRCTPCSPGCANCWHFRMADRLMGIMAVPDIERTAYAGLRSPVLTHRLTDPLKRKKPTVYGVQFMGDLFHEAVTKEQKHKIFTVIDLCPQHTFLLLTKRPKNVTSFWFIPYPKNVWLGVTVCNQAEADERIPILLSIPAADRWVSVEPALGPVDFTSKEVQIIHPDNEGYGVEMIKGLDFVTAGAETGPGARPADNDWFRSVRDQCKGYGVPYFQKATTGPTPDDLKIYELPKWDRG